MKSRNWVFTLNNPKLIDLASVLDDDNIRCLLAVLEVSTSGTTHYQGVVQLRNPRAISTMRSLIPRAHWEIQRGSKMEAYKYVLKTCEMELLSKVSVDSWRTGMEEQDGATDGEAPLALPPWISRGIDGTFAELCDSLEGKKKKRSLTERLAEIQVKLQSGVTEQELSEEHFSEWVRYRTSFKAYKALHSAPRDFKTEVTVIQGPTGTGKSRYCSEEYPDAYWKARDQWWDNYEAQEVIIIDEFYGWIPFDLLLRMLDRYPLKVEVKGGKVNFCPKKIIITTNKTPNTWYKDAYFPALARRVEHWWVFGTIFQMRYNNYYEAKFIEAEGPQEGELGF